MPYAPNKPCAKAGCPNLTKETHCEAHVNFSKKQHDNRRGSAASRGYDAKWRKLRLAKLAENPLCECENCKRDKKVKRATLVHHIKNALDYPELRLEWDNLESMANDCHEIIEAERGKRWGM